MKTATAADVVELSDRRAAKHDAADAARAERIGQLRAEIADELDTIVEQARRLRSIAGTRHHVGPGFIAPATRMRIDAQVRADRKLRRTLPDRVDATGQPIIGQDWMNPSVSAIGIVTPAPVQPGIVSIDADIVFTLQHWVRRLGPSGIAGALEEFQQVRDLENTTGVCQIPQPAAYRNPLLHDVPVVDERDVPDLARHLKHLTAAYTNRQRLEKILRELTWLTTQAAEVIQGPAKTEHSDPCPFCGRQSLVVRHRDENGAELPFQIIRCERLDSDHACECDDPTCTVCHLSTGGNPWTGRHEWSGAYSRRHHGSLDYLRILIDEAQENRAMETRARDRLTAIEQLHTPTHGDHELHGYIPWADPYLPKDHQCTPKPADVGDRLDGEANGGAWCVDGLRHYVTGCIECSQQTPSDVLAAVEPWPCPTWRLTQLDLPDPATD